MMKEEIQISKANRLINHGAVILVTSHFEGKSNIITLAWQMPVSHNPMLIALAIAKTHYSHELIKTGDHSIFIGEVLAASAETGLFDGCWRTDEPNAKTLHHLGGNLYTTSDKRIKA